MSVAQGVSPGNPQTVLFSSEEPRWGGMFEHIAPPGLERIWRGAFVPGLTPCAFGEPTSCRLPACRMPVLQFVINIYS